MSEIFFRPSLIIFVEKIGKDIYKQFNLIMNFIGLTESLKRRIGLMLYSSNRAVCSFSDEQTFLNREEKAYPFKFELDVGHMLRSLWLENKSDILDIGVTK